MQRRRDKVIVVLGGATATAAVLSLNRHMAVR
jgi:hypothetical protein